MGLGAERRDEGRGIVVLLNTGRHLSILEGSPESFGCGNHEAIPASVLALQPGRPERLGPGSSTHRV